MLDTTTTTKPAPSNDLATIHFVEVDYGRPIGCSFRETDTIYTEAHVVEDVLTGQFDKLNRVLAVNPSEGFCRDVTEDVARFAFDRWAQSIDTDDDSPRTDLEALFDRFGLDWQAVIDEAREEVATLKRDQLLDRVP